MTDQIVFWRGRLIQTLSKAELIEAIVELGEEMNEWRGSLAALRIKNMQMMLDAPRPK